MKKRVTELKANDVIDPPAAEKKWLWEDGTKRRYTVTGIKEGQVTKKGLYIKIMATVSSPYSEDNRQHETFCLMLNTKSVTVFAT